MSARTVIPGHTMHKAELCGNLALHEKLFIFGLLKSLSGFKERASAQISDYVLVLIHFWNLQQSNILLIGVYISFEKKGTSRY